MHSIGRPERGRSGDHAAMRRGWWSRVVDGASARRRRARTHAPRQRQVVLRFADDEYRVVEAAATAEGLAVGAWLGTIALRVLAEPGDERGGADVGVVVGLPELMRLHADVVALSAQGGDDVTVAARRLLGRIDRVVDLLVQQADRRTRRRR